MFIIVHSMFPGGVARGDVQNDASDPAPDHAAGGRLLHPLPPLCHAHRHELLRGRHPRQPRARRGRQKDQTGIGNGRNFNLVEKS